MKTRNTEKYLLEFDDTTFHVAFKRKGDGMVIDGSLDRNPSRYCTVKTNYLEVFDDNKVHELLDGIFKIKEKPHEAGMVA